MKTLDEFIELIAELFYRTNHSNLKANTMFHDLDEWSSLIAISIIAMVYDEFRVTLKGDELHDCVTVEDLYKLVISKM